MAGILCGHLSLSVSILLLLNILLVSSTGNSNSNSNSNSSPDVRLPSSSPPPSLPPSLTPLLSSKSRNNNDIIKSSYENTVENATAVETTNGKSQNTTSSNVPLWKQKLPFPLNNKTKTLQRILIPGGGHPKGKDVEVFLLGTAHVSKDSSRDVRQLLESV